MEKFDVNVVMTYLFYILVSGYFLFLLQNHVKNIIKTKTVIKNIRNLKYSNHFDKSLWKMLDSNYVYLPETFYKQEGLVSFKLNNFIINKKKNLPDVLHIDVFDKNITEIWDNKKSLLSAYGLLDKSSLKNKQWLPYRLNFSKSWYYLLALSVLGFILLKNSFGVAYYLFAFEFFRVSYLFLKMVIIDAPNIIDINITDAVKKGTLGLANEKSTAHIKSSVNGYSLKYLSLYFNQEDNFLPMRVDITKNRFESNESNKSNQLIYPVEKFLIMGGYNEFIKEFNIDFEKLTEPDIDLLKLNFGH